MNHWGKAPFSQDYADGPIPGSSKRIAFTLRIGPLVVDLALIHSRFIMISVFGGPTFCSRLRRRYHKIAGVVCLLADIASILGNLFVSDKLLLIFLCSRLAGL